MLSVSVKIMRLFFWVGGCASNLMSLDVCLLLPALWRRCGRSAMILDVA